MNETNQTKVITFNALGKYEKLRPTVTPFMASYATMKEMQQLGKLIPGQLYRITDYVTTVNSLTVTNARSAGHQFDILVVALNETTLSEEAWAVPHDGDTYFKDSRLEAWQLKYRLDNEDVTESGKGTITWMKDEWGNEAAYDFKNIQQKRWKVTDELGRSSIDGKYLGVLNNLPEKLSIEDESDFIWAYLYSVYNYAGGTQDTTDHSLTGNVYEMVANFTVDSNNAFVWEDDSYEAYKSTFYGSVRNCSFFGNIQNSIISGQLNNLLINAGNGASGTINGLYTLGKIDGKTITVPTNAAYPTYAAMTTEGQMKTWNPADSLNPIESLGAYDISAAHASGGVLATYADLTAALGTNGANIPEGIRKGGMSVKFVLSSDNKYVMYLYNGTSIVAADFTNTDNWEKINLEKEFALLEQKVNPLSEAAENNDSDVVLQANVVPTISLQILNFFSPARITSYGGLSDQVISYSKFSVSVFTVEKGKKYIFNAVGGGDERRPACLASNLLSEPGKLSIIEKYGRDTFKEEYDTITIIPSQSGYLYVMYDTNEQATVKEIEQKYLFKDTAIDKKVLSCFESSLSDVTIEERTGSVYLSPLYITRSARIVSYGGSDDKVYTASEVDSNVKVYRLIAGKTYSVPSYGDGSDSLRNAVTASNYIEGYGALSIIEKYGSVTSNYQRQVLTITPQVDCYLYVQEWKDYSNDFPSYYDTQRAAVLRSDVVNNDLLKNKKWAVFGDSFSEGATNSVIPDGKYAGSKKVYPFFIGNRTGINVLSAFFKSGRTLAYPSDGTFTNSATYPSGEGYYQNVPLDVDYITFYLGINDSHHRPGSSGGDGEENTGEIPIGTISDNTTATYYGAWNVVLSWLIENRPFAHIGIIISNACETAEYRTAQLAIARKYGIPFIDMNGDDITPCMLRSQNTNIDSTIRTMRTMKQAVDYDGTKTGTVNLHPNDDAHLYESYFIEDFLRRL